MQLAVSLTSYKNTIHIFKVTYSSFCIFFLISERQLTLNASLCKKLASSPTCWCFSSSEGTYFIRQKYYCWWWCCFFPLHFENKASWLQPRLAPSRPPPWLRSISQEFSAAPVSSPSQGSAFDGEGTVTPSSGPGSLSLIRKKKSIVQECQVRKYILDISVFRKRLLFPLNFRPVQQGCYCFRSSGLWFWGNCKNWAKKILKPQWIMYWVCTNFQQ